MIDITKATDAELIGELKRRQRAGCGHALVETEILRLAGAICSARRKTRAPGTGRPRTMERCPCGMMTVARAAQRNHRCQPLPVP